MNYRKEDFLQWLKDKYNGEYIFEKIHRDMTPCIVWTGKRDKRWGVPMKGSKYVCRVVAAKTRGGLFNDESPYRLCCNKLCINPEHLTITKKGETCWFHKDQDTYWRRKETMKLHGKAKSVKAAQNEVKDKHGCVSKPSAVRAILRKQGLREKMV